MPRLPRTTTTPAPRLTFNAGKHEYRYDGQILPGTTAILRGAGQLGDVARIPACYMERGRAAHEWMQADDEGRVGPGVEIPSIIRPYIDAWRLFRAQASPEILAVEELVAERREPPRYATMIDRRLRLGGAEWVINIKTGGAWPHYAAQLALEVGCCRTGLRRACLYLSKTGRYRLDEHVDPTDFRVAEDAIRAYYAAQDRAAILREVK